MQFTLSNICRRSWLRSTVLAGAGCAALLPGGGALAQEWPTKPVKFVVGLAPGSAGDLLMRNIAPRLEAVWKQPVIVENRPGAGGIVATEYVAAATDSHTFLLGSLSSLLPKYTTKNLRYDPLKDIVPVYRVVNYQLVIATNAKTAQKASSLKDMVELSKKSPQGLFFSGTGPTSIFNLSMAVVAKSTGLRYSTVDFNNVPAMNMALLRDDAQLIVNTPSLLKAQIDSGEIRPLAAISKERFPNLPDVPTVGEAVRYNGFLPLSWAAVFAPKATPKAVVDRVGRDLLTLLGDAEFKKALEARVTGSILKSSPTQFGREYIEEAKVWEDIFVAMNYKLE